MSRYELAKAALRAAMPSIDSLDGILLEAPDPATVDVIGNFDLCVTVEDETDDDAGLLAALVSLLPFDVFDVELSTAPQTGRDALFLTLA